MTDDAIMHLTAAINRLAQALEAGGVFHSTPPAPPPSPSRPLPAAGESRGSPTHRATFAEINLWGAANGILFVRTNLDIINRRRKAMGYKPFEWNGN
jgi:hypothetical protein